jgi:hypothetical protein
MDASSALAGIAMRFGTASTSTQLTAKHGLVQKEN